MDNIFIEPSASTSAPEKPKPSRRKTKKEMNDEEYMRVCERMAKMRENKKANLDKPKVEKPVKEKEVIKYVDRPVEVVKEIVKEVVKEVPAKTKTYKDDLFGDTDELRNELKEVKSMLAEMHKAKKEKQAAKQAAASKPEEPVKQQEPVKQEPVKPTPEPPKKFIYTGPMGMFRPF